MCSEKVCWGTSLQGPSKFISDWLSLSSGLGWDLQFLSLLGLSSPCWLIPPPPIPEEPLLIKECLGVSLPEEENQKICVGPALRDSLSKPKQSFAGFDNEDLQPRVSFLGNTVCRCYEQQLHSIWYLGRQQA